ncbi:MAG TPA: helix-turn-helix transcriptional regulator [Edaphobacter sp.]|jgi:DNA-binding PadR family transcriptional regulator|nr:helix-turn-helix transcriptional regulator [Edaphobacter sp.]
MMSYRNLWEIAVLALLREAPMHPYQMQILLRERHKDELLTLKRGSLYHAINRLMATGLIQAADIGRSGRRPERTTYRITPEGRQELIRVLRQMVEVPRHESSEFMAAMSFLLHLDHKDAMVRLEERAERMEEEIQALADRLKSAQERVDRINLIESEYLLAMRRAELKWVRSLIPELRSGDLVWDIKKIFQEVRAGRKAASNAKER